MVIQMMEKILMGIMSQQEIIPYTSVNKVGLNAKRN